MPLIRTTTEALGITGTEIRSVEMRFSATSGLIVEIVPTFNSEPDLKKLATTELYKRMVRIKQALDSAANPLVGTTIVARSAGTGPSITFTEEDIPEAASPLRMTIGCDTVQGTDVLAVTGTVGPKSGDDTASTAEIDVSTKSGMTLVIRAEPPFAQMLSAAKQAAFA